MQLFFVIGSMDLFTGCEESDTCKILSNDKETCSMCLKPFKKKLENSRTLKLALKLFLVLHDWEIFSMLIFDEI